MMTESFMPFLYPFSHYLYFLKTHALLGCYYFFFLFSLELSLYLFQSLCIQILFLFSLELAQHVFQFSCINFCLGLGLEISHKTQDIKDMLKLNACCMIVKLHLLLRQYKHTNIRNSDGVDCD